MSKAMILLGTLVSLLLGAGLALYSLAGLFDLWAKRTYELGPTGKSVAVMPLLLVAGVLLLKWALEGIWRLAQKRR